MSQYNFITENSLKIRLFEGVFFRPKHYTVNMGETTLRTSFIHYIKNDRNEYKAGRDLLVSEMGLNRGESIIDLALVNGSLHGYEIKSDVDTLARLSRQVGVYERYFSYLTVIVTKKHLNSFRKKYPKWIGIVLAREENNSLVFKKIRKAKENKSVSNQDIVKLLWKREALNILTELKSDKGYRNKNKNEIWNKVAGLIDMESLIKHVKLAFRRRQDWQVV